MIKMYNLKILYKLGDETIPSNNLFRLAMELKKLGCSSREFDYISEMRIGEICRTNAFEVKRYN